MATTTDEARAWLDAALSSRLAPEATEWLEGARAEIAAGADAARLAALISLASRRIPKDELAPAASELFDAGQCLTGWNPERWRVLDAARSALVLARPELDTPDGAAAVEEAFRYADVGELCALYRTLALLPEPKRFLWRAGEGARSNMRAVFEAACCDTPYPFTHFDDVAWRQAVIKCLFVEGPLWRVYGLDDRLSPELARMALDLADERRAAGRRVFHELWLCLGDEAGKRGLEAVELELAGDFPLGRRAAALALGRMGELERLRTLVASESDEDVRDAMQEALEGQCDQTSFQELDLSFAS